MIILGVPHNISEYYIADGNMIFLLTRAGFRAKYMDDDGTQYFKLNAKLQKFLDNLER